MSEVADEVALVVVESAGQVVVSRPEASPVIEARRDAVMAVERPAQVLVEKPDPQVHVLAVGSQGPAGATGGATEFYTAGAALGGHRVVVTNEDGEAVYADNATEAHANAATKITLHAAVQGDLIEVQMLGRITESSFDWTPGDRIYVGTNGQLTTTPPESPAAFSKVVAVAEAPRTILIVHESPVMLA